MKITETVTGRTPSNGMSSTFDWIFSNQTFLQENYEMLMYRKLQEKMEAGNKLTSSEIDQIAELYNLIARRKTRLSMEK